MGTLIYLYAAVVLIAAALAWIAVRSAGYMSERLGAMALALAMITVGYVGLLELLGRPKPIELEWGRGSTEEAEVLASDLREGQAIYLWLRSDGEVEPLSYRLPWSLEQAKSLLEATRRAEASGTATRMRRPFSDPLEDDEPLFYAAPQAALPPKQDVDP
jgi:hypothetical protein